MGPDRFDDQGFVVTGGTEGVGPAVVLQAALRGANVIFSGPPESENRSGEILAAAHSGGMVDRISYVSADLALPSEVDRLFDLASERLPALHVLVVNLAEYAAMLRGKSLLETSLSDWDHGLSRHLGQLFLITRRALEEFLVAGGGGRIVYITSAAMDDASSHVSVMAAQAALASFVRSVTREYGRRGIASNAVAVRSASKSTMAQARFDAAAEAVLFLASSEASFVNGEVLEVTV